MQWIKWCKQLHPYHIEVKQKEKKNEQEHGAKASKSIMTFL